MKKKRELLPVNLGKVLEIGSLNVGINGTAREVYEKDCESYLGIDMREN